MGGDALSIVDSDVSEMIDVEGAPGHIPHHMRAISPGVTLIVRRDRRLLGRYWSRDSDAGVARHAYGYNHHRDSVLTCVCIVTHHYNMYVRHDITIDRVSKQIDAIVCIDASGRLFEFVAATISSYCDVLRTRSLRTLDACKEHDDV